MKKIFDLLSIFLMGIIMTSCEDNGIPPLPDWPKANHTLLIYMTADNSLSDYCAVNLRSCVNGLLDWEAPINLVIYRDNFSSGDDGLPVLYQLKRNYVHPEKVDTIIIHQFEKEQDSTDPEILHAVIEEAFQACPAEVKGLELWSHGLGWAPGDSYQPTRTSENGASTTRSQQYIGVDNSNFLEIWDLRKALDKGPHLDYLIFDACNMAQAEVAYELRNNADYMLACPTEIMGEGLPYAVMVKSLSACSSKQQIPSAVDNIFIEFSSHYPGTNRDNGGTLSLIDLTKISTLRENYKSLLAACEDRLIQLQERPYTYEDYMQKFGRAVVNASYCFYDIQDVADFLVDGRTEIPEYKRFKDALNAVMLKEYHTDYLLNLRIKTCCGLGVGLPEVFGSISYNKNKLLSAYDELLWSKD